MSDTADVHAAIAEAGGRVVASFEFASHWSGSALAVRERNDVARKVGNRGIQVCSACSMSGHNTRRCNGAGQPLKPARHRARADQRDKRRDERRARVAARIAAQAFVDQE
jgi:hypothetical protein